MPHGIRIFLNASVIVAWIILLAIVIIPVSIAFKLSMGGLLLVLFFVSVCFMAAMTLKPPKIYLTFDYGIITYSDSIFFGWGETKIPISDIEKVHTISETTKILYVIPISTSENGLILENSTGDQFTIQKSLFNEVSDYEEFKKILFASTSGN